MFEIASLQRRGIKTSQFLNALIKSLQEAGSVDNVDNLKVELICDKLGVDDLSVDFFNETMLKLRKIIEYTEHKLAFCIVMGKPNDWCFSPGGIEPLKDLLFAVEQDERSDIGVHINLNKVETMNITQTNKNKGDVNNAYNPD
jgi:hypothetical protein